MLKLWNVFSDLVAFQSIFWTLLRVLWISIYSSLNLLGKHLWIVSQWYNDEVQISTETLNCNNTFPDTHF